MIDDGGASASATYTAHKSFRSESGTLKEESASNDWLAFFVMVAISITVVGGVLLLDRLFA